MCVRGRRIRGIRLRRAVFFEKHIPDTLSSVKVVVNDSLKYSNDTIDVDTLGEIPLSSNAITNMIKYKAQDSIAMEPNGKHAFIYKKGIIDYQDLNS